MQRTVPGQRWISTSEPSLGLGIVVSAADGRAEFRFPAAGQTRLYAMESAPLVRVRFKPGDRIEDRTGQGMTVAEVAEDGGLLKYRHDGGELCESRLADSLGFATPGDRLLAGVCGDFRDFDLRRQSLEWNQRIRGCVTRGLRGARIDLIPHQLAIVAETCRRVHPRVMLADEVGLGKTIEACLILRHLYDSGRAGRVLVLVPEPLVHQWFVELLRRFNLLFAIYDEARCEAITRPDPTANPFADESLILAAVPLLAGDSARLGQARDAGFDLLIVDEAHHLAWSPGRSSPEYAAVESLSAAVPSLLLLTATPQQLGAAGHFARLRLLDPERYPDPDAFAAEADAYAPLAAVVEGLLSGVVPAETNRFASGSPHARTLLDRLAGGDESARAPLVRGLIDTFGTGRVMFRNTRRRLTGFPERHPHLHPLAEGVAPTSWLADMLRSLPETEKILLITGSPEEAVAAREDLLARIQVDCALFHEGLGLVQRDRNAAWFAETGGARILITSEIGSEGRNFQFARHLVLFGLPRNPELLEQRIGRLDRIGQTGTIHIHVPFQTGSRLELHARWLHEGLDAFARPLRGASTLAEELLPILERLPDDVHAPEFQALLEISRARRAETEAALDRGHDRLLELSAPPPEEAAGMIRRIAAWDRDLEFERFALRLFDRLGLDLSESARRTYRITRGQRLSEAFSGLPDEGITATFDRPNALAREDLALLSADHPMLRDAIDHLLASETGSATFAVWERGAGKGILLEACFVLEALAPTRLHVDRFLPPTSICVSVDHHGREIPDAPAPALLRAGDVHQLVRQPEFRQKLFPKLMAAATGLAETKRSAAADAARSAAEIGLRQEISRLESLASRNPHIDPSEIRQLEDALAQTSAALAAARLRPDSLRLIWCA